MRDSQRQKLYDSERDAFRWKCYELDPRFDVGSIEGAQKVVDAVWASATLLADYTPQWLGAPTVKAGHGKRQRGCYRVERNEIHLPRACGLKWYVLHECAHALVPSEDVPAHGREFAACYLDLIRVFMGRGWSEALTTQFKAHGVKFKPKRAYTISDVERERRSQRAMALRGSH